MRAAAIGCFAAGRDVINGFGTAAGLTRYRYGNHSDYEDGLADNFISALLEDSSGALWIEPAFL